MRVQTIRFDDRRRPRPRDKIVLGFEGDNLVERLEFILPVIADAQTAQLMMGGKYANAVLLQRDGEAYYADLTAEIVGTDGEVEAYVQINGSGGEAWHSDVLRLITGALPDVETEIETRYPTAVETMLSEIAGHRAEMSETLGEAQAAADRAEDAVVNPPIIGDNGHWLLWDFETGRYIDSGVAAQGPPGQAYTLPPATPDTLGGIMPSDGLSVDETGRVRVDNELELLLTHEVTAENRADTYRFEFDDVSELECYMFFPKIEGGTTERVSGYIGHIGYYIEDALNPYADKYCLLQYKKALGRFGFDGIQASREGYSVLVKTIGMFMKPQSSSDMNCAIAMNSTTQGYPIGTKFDIYGKKVKRDA